MNTAQTFWNGEPCQARRVRVIVADNPDWPKYWARPYVGQERNAVEVVYGNQTFYLDDEAHVETDPQILAILKRVKCEAGHRAGSGWAKVTIGQGSPQFGHANLSIERVVCELEAAP